MGKTINTGRSAPYEFVLGVLFRLGWGYLRLTWRLSKKGAWVPVPPPAWAQRERPVEDGGGWIPNDLPTGEEGQRLALADIEAGRPYGLSPPEEGAVLDFDTAEAYERFTARKDGGEFASGALQIGSPRPGARHLYTLLPGKGALRRFQSDSALFGEGVDSIVHRRIAEKPDRRMPKGKNGAHPKFPTVARFFTVGPGSERPDPKDAEAAKAKPGGLYRIVNQVFVAAPGMPESLPVMVADMLSAANAKTEEAAASGERSKRTGKGRKGDGSGEKEGPRSGARRGGRKRKPPEEEAAEDAREGRRWTTFAQWSSAAHRMAWRGADADEIEQRLTAINATFKPPSSVASEFRRIAEDAVAWAADKKAGRAGEGIFDAARVAFDLTRYFEGRGEAILPHPNDPNDGYLRFIPDNPGETPEGDGMDRPGHWLHEDAEVIRAEVLRRVVEFRIEEGIHESKNAKISAGLLSTALRFVADRFASEIIKRCGEPGTGRGVPWDRDADVAAFPVGSPVFDFKRGEFRAERYDDLIRYRLAFAPDREMKTPEYDRFMETITCDRADLRDDLERIPATSILQRHRQRMLFWFGPTGGNGKGTLNTLFADILGTLHCSVGSEWRRSGTAFWEANLEGKTLIVFDDTAGGAKRFPWDDLKALSGNQTLSAAAKNKPTREWANRGTYLFVVNDLPLALMKQGPIARRLAVFPFDWTARDSEDGEDPDLPKKLRAEGPGIVARYLDRARAIYATGDYDPEPHRMGPTVRAATDAGWASIAAVARFFAARLVFEDGAVVRKAAVWKASKDWCTANGERITQGVLYAEMAKHKRLRIARNKDDGDAESVFGCRLREGETEGPDADPGSDPADPGPGPEDRAEQPGIFNGADRKGEEMRCDRAGCSARAVDWGWREGGGRRAWCAAHADDDPGEGDDLTRGAERADPYPDGTYNPGF